MLTEYFSFIIMVPLAILSWHAIAILVAKWWPGSKVPDAILAVT